MRIDSPIADPKGKGGGCGPIDRPDGAFAPPGYGFLEGVNQSTIFNDLGNLAPTPVGQTIHCTARVIAVDGGKVSFQIEARDAYEVIVRGLHKRAVIQTESFSRRVKAKYGV